MVLIYWIVYRYSGSTWYGGMAFCLASLLSKTNEFASGGGTEPLSLMLMLLAWSIWLWKSEKVSWLRLILYFGILYVGCFCRPHNQFLLMASVILILDPLNVYKKWFLFFWLMCLGTYFLSIEQMSSEATLKFPYLFSFLVGTPGHPGHAIFREYWNGFGVMDLFDHKALLIDKIKLGAYILKQYWSHWLPHVLILLCCSLFSKRKALCHCLLLVYVASLFFGGMGHLVPRYWEDKWGHS